MVARAADRLPRRSVLVLGIYARDGAGSMARPSPSCVTPPRRARSRSGRWARPALSWRRHRARGARGRGQVREPQPAAGRRAGGGRLDHSWSTTTSSLPRGFLGRFLACAEGFGLQLAQPAHRHTSHAAWSVTRRARWSLARRTRLVEIGPVTAFHPRVAGELLPFPPLRMGWGLDSYWGGLAQERGWRLGVVDATPIRHESRRPASDYDRDGRDRGNCGFSARQAACGARCRPGRCWSASARYRGAGGRSNGPHR